MKRSAVLGKCLEVGVLTGKPAVIEELVKLLRNQHFSAIHDTILYSSWKFSESGTLTRVMIVVNLLAFSIFITMMASDTKIILQNARFSLSGSHMKMSALPLLMLTALIKLLQAHKMFLPTLQFCL